MPHWTVTAEFRADISQDELEATGLELVEQGALGAHVSGARTVSFFLEGSKETVKDWARTFFDEQTVELSLEQVGDTNWVARCSDIVAPIQCGQVIVHPVIAAVDVPQTRSNATLYLIPGLGFGTGHHATTKTALEVLQTPEVAQITRARPESAILDVGTGSGILAIGAVQLLDRDVIATDIDEAALGNARENASLNGVGERIRFSGESLSEVARYKPYSLIIANIYAEVLVSMEEDFYRLLSPGTLLLLSGIMAARYGMISQAFSQTRWRTTTCREVDNWITLLMERV